MRGCVQLGRHLGLLLLLLFLLLRRLFWCLFLSLLLLRAVSMSRTGIRQFCPVQQHDSASGDGHGPVWLVLGLCGRTGANR